MVIKETSVGCRSEQHVDSCPCKKCKPRNCDPCTKWDVQHEIPERIGLVILKMSKKELDQYTHPESKVCHAANDKRIGFVFKNMLRNIETYGCVYTKEMVLEMRRKGLFRQNHSQDKITV
jgi:hypothetical protein